MHAEPTAVEKTRIGAPWQDSGRQMYGATWFHVGVLSFRSACGWLPGWEQIGKNMFSAIEGG